jgi:phosphate transport system protein
MPQDERTQDILQDVTDESTYCKAYDEELETLHRLIQQMGELTLEQIQKAIHSLVEHNEKLAHEVIDRDYEINHLETRVDELAIRILALRQPVASDLRTVVAALKISNQVERIADYASNIANAFVLDFPPSTKSFRSCEETQRNA